MSLFIFSSLLPSEEKSFYDIANPAMIQSAHETCGLGLSNHQFSPIEES
jgi:hypothetical protein